MNGTLYGTTEYGGGSGCGANGGCGTVFAVSTSGKERVLYRFKSGTDGAQPFAPLIAVRSTLYGTTYSGGENNHGTVFAVNVSGKEHILHRLKGGIDGEWPEAGLIDVNGKMYGTTTTGGHSRCRDGCGIVFEVSATGVERVLYRFKGNFKGIYSDGAYPAAALMVANGSLYGTTAAGGGSECVDGCGTVFELSTSGVERVLYPFKAGTDGDEPEAGLIAAGGRIYGTTPFGGKSSYGTVFEVSKSGEEQVLHEFKGGKDGAEPFATLIEMGGTLYGTTSGGGTSGGGSDGTVFRISP
jgi:uncharacterized repeat protein (TIGR03803 family)